jgi:hypothetical protein
MELPIVQKIHRKNYTRMYLFIFYCFLFGALVNQTNSSISTLYVLDALDASHEF